MNDDPSTVETARPSTAHHEAGHAVIAIHLGLPIGPISIKDDGESFGRMAHPTILGIDFGSDHTRRARVVTARDQITMAFAGFEAERRFDRNAQEVHSAQDAEDARELAHQWGISDRSLARLRGKARRLVEEQNRTIVEFASMLMERVEMTGPEAEAEITALLASTS
jgi:hypothetical protein